MFLPILIYESKSKSQNQNDIATMIAQRRKSRPIIEKKEDGKLY